MPHEQVRPRTIGGRTIPEGMKVVTFVAKSLEQLRGFDRFLRLANALMPRPCRRRRGRRGGPDGDSDARRGTFHGRDYREQALQADPPPDPDRLWFLGTVVSPDVVGEVLARSDLHVYPSRTYPASRSLLRAMAAGRAVLASDDAPVRELIRPEVDGLLASPDDLDDWVRLASRVLGDPAGHAGLGESAANVVRERYDRDVTLPLLAGRLNQLAGLGG